MNKALSKLPSDYWLNFTPSKSELEYISTYLFEKETPLSEKEIVPIIVEERIKVEKDSLKKMQEEDSSSYLPENQYSIGDRLAFPALDWAEGKVIALRPGTNPSMGEFDVVEVLFDGGQRKEFAARLENHKLNHPPEQVEEDPLLNPVIILSTFGNSLESALTKSLQADKSLVQVAGRWFPKSLLVDINVGFLNMVEAVLEEAGGKPLPTNSLIEQVALPMTENPRLVEFSMNFALQEDGRFDEVGPVGEVLWCLKRLEPSDVQQIPVPLRYIAIEYDRTAMTKEMIALEASIDDELIDFEGKYLEGTEVTISLTYPHWRAGTLPISARTKALFPTAYESPRVRFTVIDSQSKEEIPAWVVRQHGYVAGLAGLYKRTGLIPGSLVTMAKGPKPGQVIVGPKTRRPVRDWVRTVLVGSDGGLVFATLKQNLACEVNERMVIAVPDVSGIDLACETVTKQRLPFDRLVSNMMQELTKLNVQGHVHALELFSAINIIRRCPPGPILVHLAQSSAYRHVGDLHFRLVSMESDNE